MPMNPMGGGFTPAPMMDMGGGLGEMGQKILMAALQRRAPGAPGAAPVQPGQPTMPGGPMNISPPTMQPGLLQKLFAPGGLGAGFGGGGAAPGMPAAPGTSPTALSGLY